MNATAEQLTIGPLATARSQAPGVFTFSEHDEEYRTRPFTWSARESLALAVAALLVALMVVALSQAMSSANVETPAVTPDEVFVVDPDGAEPIICAVQAGVRRCAPMELGPAQP